MINLHDIPKEIVAPPVRDWGVWLRETPIFNFTVNFQNFNIVATNNFTLRYDYIPPLREDDTIEYRTLLRNLNAG